MCVHVWFSCCLVLAFFSISAGNILRDLQDGLLSNSAISPQTYCSLKWPKMSFFMVLFGHKHSPKQFLILLLPLVPSSTAVAPFVCYLPRLHVPSLTKQVIVLVMIGVHILKPQTVLFHCHLFPEAFFL